MKILLAGGGTLGPVTPLFAIVEAWRARDAHVEFILVGTPDGPERSLAQRYGIPFFSLPPVRFVRFFSFEWFLLPFRAITAMFLSWKFIVSEKPRCILGAGGFSQVSVIFVARLLGIPSFILQTDVRPLLSNRLSAPFARRIFVSWQETASDFSSDKIVCSGIPVRASILKGSRERAMARYHLRADKPTLLVFGGGTGSLFMNECMAEIGSQLREEMNVIHITGRGKGLKVLEGFGEGYVAIEHVEEGMEDIYALADLVVCRAGSGTISELAALKKAAILIPLAGAQQDNARVVEQYAAARVLVQAHTTGAELLHVIREVQSDESIKQTYRERLGSFVQTNVSFLIIDAILSSL